MSNYDYVIIGAGPCGIALAYALSLANKSILLIDKNSSLGGCHRVTRVQGLFTEHGPRIYSNSYVNTIELLEHMNIQFNDIFTPYNFPTNTIFGSGLQYFTISELSKFSWEFIKLTLGINDISRKISVKQFVDKHNFSDKAKIFVDRICRLTDGAGSDRYALYNFLALANIQSLYKIYQPREPNDVGLFAKIDKVLLDKGITIKYNTEVLMINTDNEQISNIVIKNPDQSIEAVTADNFLFCIPPKPFETIISTDSNVKASYPNFESFVNRNSYINDIPVVFHWDTKLEFNKVWGFPKTDWGIAHIVLSDYMNFDDARSQTVISTCITLQDGVSKTGKTPDDCNADELIEEVFSQLRTIYPTLPNYSYALIHPNVKRIDNKWIETDTAYVYTYHYETMPMQNSKYNNLFFVGTQNGIGPYPFTSFESAVTNALYLAHKLEPITKQIKLKRPETLTFWLRFILIITLFIIIYFVMKRML